MAGTTFDVAIAGGGVIGLSIAWELAQQGATVCVIDGGEPGRQASWAASGMLPPGPRLWLDDHFSPLEQMAGLSQELNEPWHERLLEQTGIDNGFRPSGALYLGQDLTEHCKEWHRRGIEYRRLEAAEVREIEPALEPSGETVFLPEEAQLRPPWHLMALRTACEESGVEFHHGGHLREVRPAGDRVDQLTTERGKILAGRFCLCAGCWSEQLARTFGLSLPTVPIRGQIALLKGSFGVLRHIINVGPRYLTPRSDGRVLIGSTQESAGFESVTTAGAVGELLRFAVELCPALAAFELETCWAGLRPATPDGLPYLGRIPGFQNFWVATGHFRAGFQLAAATGVVMRCLMLGQDSPVEISSLGIERIDSGHSAEGCSL